MKRKAVKENKNRFKAYKQKPFQGANKNRFKAPLKRNLRCSSV